MPRVRPVKVKSLLDKAAKVVAKNAKLKDLKGEIPDELVEVVQHKQRKKAYDEIHKATSSNQVNQMRKTGAAREVYKNRRKTQLQQKDWKVYTDAHISNKEK